MKQYPSRLKYKKNHRPSKSLMYLNEKKNFYAISGLFLLKSKDNCKLTYNQIEACRKSIRRSLRKQGKVYIRLFTNISVTKKSLGSRMGSGKGSHSFWICSIKKGQVVCEVISSNFNKALIALNDAGSKLPIKTVAHINKY